MGEWQRYTFQSVSTQPHLQKKKKKIMKLSVICFLNSAHLDSRVWSIKEAAGHNHIIWHHMNKPVGTNCSNLLLSL